MIKANFTAYGSYVTDSLYQWDKNRTLTVTGITVSVAPEVHFTNAILGKAIVKQGTLSGGTITAAIPNSLLQEAFAIRAYIGVYEGTAFKTIEVVEIPVIRRARPEDYTIDTGEEVYSFKALENAIAQMATKTEVANIIAHNNDTDGNTELIDIRRDINDNVHGSAGLAIRAQIGTVKSSLDNQLTLIATESFTGYYNQTKPLNPEKVYAIGITVSTSGSYTIQAGSNGNVADMIDTICENTPFVANAEKIIIGYKPTANFTHFRISSEMNWTLKVYEMIGDNTLKEIDTDIYNIASNFVSYISTGEYVTSDSKCPQKFTALDTSKKYAVGITVTKNGRYTIKTGASAAETEMVDTVCDNLYFRENIEKIIVGYIPTGNFGRARISDEIDWTIKIYEIIDSKALRDNVNELNNACNDMKFDIDSLKNVVRNTRLIAEVSNENETSHYYNRVSSVTYMKTYAIGVKASETGVYSIQAGATGSLSAMVDTVCSDMSFTANEEKIIYGYKPTGNYSQFRLSEDIPWELKVYEVIDPVDVIDVMANKYDNELISRDRYLRQYHYYTGDEDIFYGVEWTENQGGVTRINTEGYDDLHISLPIQSKMRRCVVKNGVLQYYLYEHDSTLKPDFTPAKLDGTDGDVCVEIPEFFYKFEISTDTSGKRNVKLKISEQGLNGFNYSPKMYVGAYEATINRNTNILASVCTTASYFREEDVKVKSDSDYSELLSGGGLLLGKKKVAVRLRSEVDEETAVIYRGGNNDSSFDDVWDFSSDDFCRNQLGLPVARMSRDGFRKCQDIANGKFMYLYDAHKALWILSTVEFACKNIQTAIESGGLGKGATVYHAYDAYKQWQKNYTESIIPCGVTNCLGNNSGEVFYKLHNVPVAIDGTFPNADLSTIERADMWIPCMSYRGVEHYYGHLYKTLDQITVSVKYTGETSDEDGKPISNVSYYYQKNPFRTDNLMLESELIGTYKFCPNIRNTTSYIFGMDGHILPYDTTGQKGYEDESTYCDCTEFLQSIDNAQIDVNGSIISGKLPGRNFMVACFAPDDDLNARVSNGTRITYVCTR